MMPIRSLVIHVGHRSRGLVAFKCTQVLTDVSTCTHIIYCPELRASQCERNVPEKIRTNVKHFACSTCGNSFARVGSLNDHERIHSGVKPFTCTICGKSLAQSGSLRSHERIHSGVKPFTCTLCGKSFVRAASLRDHDRIHSIVKPFKCAICGKSFIRVGHQEATRECI